MSIALRGGPRPELGPGLWAGRGGRPQRETEEADDGAHFWANVATTRQGAQEATQLCSEGELFGAVGVVVEAGSHPPRGATGSILGKGEVGPVGSTQLHTDRVEAAAAGWSGSGGCVSVDQGPADFLEEAKR